MPNFEIPSSTQSQEFGADSLLDQYAELLSGREEKDIKDEVTIAELARLKTAILLAQSTAKKIDKELSWAGTRAEEGVALAQESVKNTETDDIKLAWEKSDPDANINAMMDHLENREQARQKEMNDVRIKINLIFREITETRRKILKEILPRCKNEYKLGIENSLSSLMNRIVQLNEDLNHASWESSFGIEQAQAYVQEFGVLSNEMQNLYKDSLDDLTDLD